MTWNGLYHQLRHIEKNTFSLHSRIIRWSQSYILREILFNICSHLVTCWGKKQINIKKIIYQNYIVQLICKFQYSTSLKYNLFNIFFCSYIFLCAYYRVFVKLKRNLYMFLCLCSGVYAMSPELGGKWAVECLNTGLGCLPCYMRDMAEAD